MSYKLDGCPGRSHDFDCSCPADAPCDSLYPDCWACRYDHFCDVCYNKAVCVWLAENPIPLGSLDTPIEPF